MVLKMFEPLRFDCNLLSAELAQKVIKVKINKKDYVSIASGLNKGIIIGLDKNGYQINIFLISR